MPLLADRFSIGEIDEGTSESREWTPHFLPHSKGERILGLISKYLMQSQAKESYAGGRYWGRTPGHGTCYTGVCGGDHTTRSPEEDLAMKTPGLRDLQATLQKAEWHLQFALIGWLASLTLLVLVLWVLHITGQLGAGTP